METTFSGNQRVQQHVGTRLFIIECVISGKKLVSVDTYAQESRKSADDAPHAHARAI